MTPLDASSPRPSFAKSAAANIRTSWETSYLRPLTRIELDSIVAIMPAWLHRREWQPPSGADVRLLWEYIDRHGLAGALGALSAADLVPPGELAERAKGRYFSNMVHCERAMKQCRKIVAAARDLGLPIVNFKGPALAEQAYGDLGVRAFSDLDLWTASRDDVFKLLAALGARITDDSDRKGPIRRMRAPDRISATLDGWELEIRYPAGESTDPMLDLLNRYPAAAPPTGDDCLGAPNPAWHLLLVILHMSWYHYSSRFVWYLDLAALAARRRREIDFEWVLQECRRLRATNLMGLASRFCRENIDPSFPEFPLDPAAWNYKFLCLVSNPRTIACGRFSLHQRTTSKMYYTLWFRTMRHYLLSDPPPRYLPNFPPESWMIATITRSFRVTGALSHYAARLIVGWVAYPLARFSAWILTVRTPGGGS
jgi:hypothetical protein